MTRMYADSRAERLLAPRRLDPIPFPDGNPALGYDFDVKWGRAWWGFILHASHTHNHREAWENFARETDAVSDDTRHLGKCDTHGMRFRPGTDCPTCSILAAAFDGAPPYELDADTVTALGLDPTGRDGDPRFPYTLDRLSPADLMRAQTLDLCECGHPGYDGHDMRQSPPTCLTHDCYCGGDE